MLYAPAICENCCAIFASTEIVAESTGESASYRRSAGPCPRCGSSGAIPEWVFKFHTIATMAMNQGTPEQLHSLIQALQETAGAALTRKTTANTTITELTHQLTGPWSGVALELRRASADQRTAMLTFLLWTADPPSRAIHVIPDPSVPQMSCAAGNLDSRSASSAADPSTGHPYSAVAEPDYARAS